MEVLVDIRVGLSRITLNRADVARHSLGGPLLDVTLSTANLITPVYDLIGSRLEAQDVAGSVKI